MRKELAFTKDKNQIATPSHIVEFLSDVLEVDTKTVLDPTAGAGAMLGKAGKPIAIECDVKAFDMLQKNVPDGYLIHDSVFHCFDWIRERKPEIVMMNPPFNCPKAEMPEDYKKRYGIKGEDSTKGLYFVKWVADAVGSGRLVAILPSGAVGYKNKAIKETKAELLRNHSLEAVLKLNRDLFYPSVSVSVVVIFLKLGEPHTGKTWIADFSEDGFEKTRSGRIDSDGKWAEIKRKWLELFEKKPYSEDERCGTVETTVEQDWSVLYPRPKVDMQPTEEDFKNTVKDYLDWKIKRDGYDAVIKSILTKEEYINLLRHKVRAMLLKIEELENE